MPPFLIPLLIGLAPKVAEWVAGKPAADVVSQVTKVAKDTLGVDNVNDLEDAISKDPEKALQFKLAMINAANEESQRKHEAEMATITSQIEEVKSYLADVQSARNQTVELVKSGSALSWGAAVVSILAVTVFGGFIYMMFVASVPDGMREALMLMAGSAASGFGAVLNYWLGSSAGSAQKTSVMEMMAKRKP